MKTLEKNVAFELVRVTEAAAMAASRWQGRGDKESGDRAAVDAMRSCFQTLEFSGIVVIGEGEKDEAPMLYNGEALGTGTGPTYDVAVDPVEGTNLLATGRPNSICVIAISPRGTMFHPGPAFYMNKTAVPAAAQNAVDPDSSVEKNLREIAKALKKSVSDLVVFVLDKPRHRELIQEIRTTGARIQLHTDGDVAGVLMAISPHTDVDVMMGTGGTPEGVIASAAVKVMGGALITRLDPQSSEEREAILAEGYDLSRVYSAEDLIQGEDVYFAATGITGGTFLRGVTHTGEGVMTHSLLMRGRTGTVRYLESYHRLEKMLNLTSD